MQITAGFLEKLINIIYPTRCVSCGKDGTLFCEDCRSKLEPFEEFFCIVCDRPAVSGFTHPGCATRYTPERALAGFSYCGPAKNLVRALKYKSLRGLVQVMADLSIEDLEEKGVAFGPQTLVVPIPLSSERERSRGFNQAALLGQALADRLGLQFQDSVLARVKDTSSQVSLKKKERKENIRGVFSAKPLTGEDILLVDDVTTTGSTVLEAAKTLKKSGSGQVWVMAFAKD